MKFVPGKMVKVKHFRCDGYHLIKIYIKSSFFNIYIFYRHIDMIDFIKKCYPFNRIVLKTTACFFQSNIWAKNKLGRLSMTRQIGEIFFNKQKLDPYIIQHECAHATLGYFRRLVNGDKKGSSKISTNIPQGEKEELFCEIAGILTCIVLESYFDIKNRVNVKCGKKHVLCQRAATRTLR